MAIRYRFYDYTGSRWTARGRTRDEKPPKDFPGTLVVRVDDYCLEPLRGENGEELRDAEGRVRTCATGVWATSVCSGSHLLVRLTDETEERAAGHDGVHPRRRSIEEMRTSNPALADPASLPEGKRPLLRCDQARYVHDPEDGRLRASIRFEAGGEAVVHAQMRCSWITPHAAFTTRNGVEVNPAEHMECARFSTVNVGLAGADRDKGPDYYALYEKSVEEAARQGVRSFVKACAEASRNIVNAWKEERGKNPQARFGSLSVTTWYPEESFRFDLQDSLGTGARALETFLSDPRFAAQTRTDENGNTSRVPGPVSPECILRFLNRDDEVCGVYRIASHDFLSLPAWARRTKREGDQAFWESPEGRTSFVLEEMVKGLDRDFVEANNVVRVDVLPGRCYRADFRLMQPELDRPGANAALFQLRNLIFQGLSQSRSPLDERRQNLGCSQAFVPRTGQDFVQGWYSVRDGSPYHNACLLLADNRRLWPSKDYALELEHERDYLNDITLCLAEEEGEEEGKAPAPGPRPGASPDGESDTCAPRP